MALTETRPETGGGDTAVAERSEPTQIERLIGSGDHLANGRLLLSFGLVFLTVSVVGLALAAIDRVTLDGALGGISDVLWDSSLLALVLVGVLPLLLGIAFHVVPLQVGSTQIAFPRAAALSLWSWLIGAVLFVTSVALDGGIGGADTDAARIGNLSVGLMMAALAVGATCVATTVLSHRPLGMGVARVPLFAWSMLVAAPIWIMTFGATAARVVVGQISHADATALSVGFEEGIAWMLRAPSVYMVAIPVLGIAGDVVATVAGRRLAPYGAFQGMIGAFGVLSFGVWTQTPGSVDTVVWVGVVVLTGLPVLALLGGLGDALRRGRVRADASLLGALLALLLVLGGVLAAAVQALDTAGSGNLFDLVTGLVADAQAVFLVSAAALGAIAGLAHWSERLFGAPASAGAARAAVGAVLVGGGLAATVLLVESIAAADGRDGLPEGVVHGIVAGGTLLVALGVLAALAAALGAARQQYEGATGESATEGLTLEWASPWPSPARPRRSRWSSAPLPAARPARGRRLRGGQLMADTPMLTTGVPAPVLPRRRELLFGTAFVTAGVVMAMITLIGSYLATRDAAGASWLSENVIPLSQPNMQLITLGMSMVTMQWAVWSINRDDRPHTYLALGVTLLLGAAFVNQTTFLYNQAAVTMSQPEGPLFAVTGGHLAMVVAGIVFIVLMTLRTFGGQFSSRQPDGIGAAALFWHATAALYALIWFAVYVQK